MSLATALEQAAAALPDDADAIRPANGDPLRLLEALDATAGVRVLAWLLSHEPEDAAELIDAWAEVEAGAAALVAVDEASLSKPGSKALRRGRHRLRSRGVAVAEPAPEPRVAALPPVDDSIEAALVTPLDPAGVCLAYLVEGDPSGGARLFEIAVDEARGVLDVSVYSAGRSKVRGFLRDIAARGGLAPLPVSPDAVRALVARAVGRQPADWRPPASFTEWKAHIAVAPADARTPGALAAAALGEPSDPGLVNQAVALVRSGGLGPWPGDAERLGAIAARVREKASSPLLVSAAQRREQADLALGQALGELYDGPGAEVVADRFRESAYGFWKRGDEDAARACLAAAASFAADSPAENPVARALLETVLAPVLEALEREVQGEAEVQPSGGPR